MPVPQINLELISSRKIFRCRQILGFGFEDDKLTGIGNGQTTVRCETFVRDMAIRVYAGNSIAIGQPIVHDYL